LGEGGGGGEGNYGDESKERYFRLGMGGV